MLMLLRDACMACASAETSCYPDGYDPSKSPLDGHCGAVATMVHGMFGGEIVSGRINGFPHYWNRLPDGSEVDLTSCQFGGDGCTPLKKGRKVKRPAMTDLTFLIFAMRVQKKLASTDG